MSKITIIQLNDVHGYVDLHNEVFYEADGIKVKEVGGYARIKTIIDEIRSINPNTIVLDCGDTFHGTFIATQTQGNALVPIMNEMGIDACTAHWDFAYTPSHLKEISYKLNYPLLSSNTYIYDKNQRLFDPYIIKEVEGLKIGIIGMACEHIVQGFPKKFSQGIYMTPEYEELPQIVFELKHKEQVDLIFLLSHLGMPTDYELLKTISDIDVCISGHTHNRLSSPIKIGKALLIQSGCHGSFITQLDLDIENKKIVNYHHKLLTVEKDIKEDLKIKQIIDKAYEPYLDYLNVVVGKTQKILCRNHAMYSSMDTFLLNAIKFVTGNNICFSHGWRYGSAINIGEITIKDLYNIVPMNPKIITVDLTGEEIIEILNIKINNTYNINPFGQTGGFIERAIGIKAYIKIENPTNYRIQKLYINNENFNPHKVYKVSYISEQTIPKKFGCNRKKCDYTAIDAMIKYLSTIKCYNENEEKPFIII